MNEEIKEIEQYLKKCSNCFTCNNFLREDKNGGHCMLQNAYNYITNLQEENEFLKLNNPEMNIEHFRIVKENKRKIDNLRKENKKIKESRDFHLRFNKSLMNRVDEYRKENQKLKETIKEAKEKSIKLQEKYNYILDDLTFILARGD